MNVKNAVILSEDSAGYGSGSFYASPKPAINLQAPSRELRERKETWGNYWTGRLVA